MSGATGVLLNVTGGPDLGLFEIDEAASIIRAAAADDCNVIFGAVIDEAAGDHIRVTVIATGFDGEGGDHGDSEAAEEPSPAAEPASGGSDRPTRLDSSERAELEIPDDALEIPDFLKGR
jgi:cell division protein FtsZ